ncbi:MAG: metallo-mystery pair system four-Cys motif protein [Solirubrobacteraceae bacterium]|nr:metallo-mystery pair system four-Cys motif protein [Solirubrobacteraceae bacterium]
MTRPTMVHLAIGIAALALPTTALAHDDHTAAKPASKTQTVKLRFAAVAGSTPVSCDAPIAGLGTSAQTAQLKDLRFFVSDVKLVRKDGTAATLKLKANKDYRVAGSKGSVSLIDLENGAGACAEEGTPGTNASVIGTVPAGKYVGVRWTLGVPFALNHTDTSSAAGPLGLSAMGWSWQFGRKFMKVEFADPAASGTAPASGGHQMAVRSAAGWASPVYYVHVGSTGCTGNPATGAAVACLAPNRADVKLAKFNPATQQVAVDVKELLAGNDLAKSPDMMPGCMSGPVDPECESEFKALGIRWSADGKANGKPTGSQSVFRPINR